MPGQREQDDLSMDRASSESESGRRSSGLIIGVVLGSVAVVGLVIGLWWAVPRSTEVPVESPSVCSYPRGGQGLGRIAVVNCMGHAVGVINDDQVLIAADWNPGADNSAGVVYLRNASERGTLRMSKPWFGSYAYSFVAEDGTVTELKETRRYIGGVVESLGG